MPSPLKHLLYTAATALVTRALAVPNNAKDARGYAYQTEAPSMANGLPGEAMRGHRWVTAPANPALERELAGLGLVDVWTG